eukprot:CAMPEP_0194322604 /NCGR_PEP_ID=MMETSP0171-20130528/21634_1 /TAXON_ID=218684 /ORGANISM="Corethron pennatum, Strain L29A3" /LENGTH=63 /DNA_ID=CAMNT_0039080923 /DNA_START=87 /DNA_END=281 /DNA_ORIENTATION=+
MTGAPAGKALNAIIREAIKGTALGTAIGVVWLGSVAKPHERTIKAYYEELNAKEQSLRSKVGE